MRNVSGHDENSAKRGLGPQKDPTEVSPNFIDQLFLLFTLRFLF